jgi:hypothetical protein
MLGLLVLLLHLLLVVGTCSLGVGSLFAGRELQVRRMMAHCACAAATSMGWMPIDAIKVGLGLVQACLLAQVLLQVKRWQRRLLQERRRRRMRPTLLEGRSRAARNARGTHTPSQPSGVWVPVACHRLSCSHYRVGGYA